MSKSSDNPMIGGDLFCDGSLFVPEFRRLVTMCSQLSASMAGCWSRWGNLVMTPLTRSTRNHGKQVARNIRESIEPGTELEASIVELSELHNPDEVLFAVPQPMAPLETIRVTEAALRGLVVGTPVIQWPTIHGGKAGRRAQYLRLR